MTVRVETEAGVAKVILDNPAQMNALNADQKERISELDVNPLICSGDRIIAVDALIVHSVVSGSVAMRI